MKRQMLTFLKKGAGLLAAVLILTGCGAQPISQTLENNDHPLSPGVTEPGVSSDSSASGSTAATITPESLESEKGNDFTETTGMAVTESSQRPAGSSAAGGTTVTSPGKGTTATAANTTKTSRSTTRQTTAGRPTGTISSAATRPTSTPAPTPAPTGKELVGYYPSWAASSGLPVDKIQADKLTQINYAFAKIDSGTLKIAMAYPTTDRRNFEQLRKLKAKYPHLKTMISVGGWDFSGYFSDAAATAKSREAFARSCVEFILEHGFDGVDLDWEYPVSGGAAGNHNRPQDKQNFTLLLQELRRQLDKQGAADGRRYYLTIAAGAGASYWDKIELTKVLSYVDHIFLMAYDLHGPWDSYADLLAPLYTPTEASPQYKSSVDAAVTTYLNKGGKASKLVLGMPFYGYRYTGVSAAGNGLYSRFSSAGSVSYDQLAASYIGKSGYTRYQHAIGRVPYLYGNNTFISYEDADSIAAKVKYAKSRGLGGVGAWALSHDTRGVLLTSAYRALQ